MILGTLNAVLVVKMTPEGGEIEVRVYKLCGILSAHSVSKIHVMS